MMGIEITIALVILILLGSWAIFTAQRLNFLHIRTDAALAQLQAALDPRSCRFGAKGRIHGAFTWAF